MRRRDKIGIVVIVALFITLGVIYVVTVDRPEGPLRGFSDNVVVKQTIINQNKSK